MTIDHFDQQNNFTSGLEEGIMCQYLNFIFITSEILDHVLTKRQLPLEDIKDVYMNLCPDVPKCPKCPECKVCPKDVSTFFPICPYATPPCPDCPSCPSCPTPTCPRCKCKWKKPRCGRCSYTMNRLAAAKANKVRFEMIRNVL